jgi:hypothetical protein
MEIVYNYNINIYIYIIVELITPNPESLILND